MLEIISVHVPKTAGTSFRKILTDIYGTEQVQDDYPPHRSYDPTTYRSTDPIKVIHGHFHAIKYKGFFVDAKRIIWLRNPIFRLISEYFYAKTLADPNNKTHLRVVEDNLSLLGFAQIPDMRNFMSRQIQQTKLEEFDFIGIQEFYEEDLVELSRLMGWKNFEIPKFNTNKAPRYLEYVSEYFSDSALISGLAQLNEQDMKLYSQSLSLRALRRGEPIDIQGMLSTWSQTRFLTQSFSQAGLKTKNENDVQVNQDMVSPKFLKVMSTRIDDISLVVEHFCIDIPTDKVLIDSKVLCIAGWVLGKKAKAVSVRVVSRACVIAEALVGVPRPDVANIFPTFEYAAYCGFNLNLDSTNLLSMDEISIQAMLINRVLVEIGSIKLSQD